MADESDSKLDWRIRIKANSWGIASNLVCLKCFPLVFVIQFSSGFYCRLLFLLLSIFRIVFNRHSYVCLYHNKRNCIIIIFTKIMPLCHWAGLIEVLFACGKSIQCRFWKTTNLNQIWSCLERLSFAFSVTTVSTSNLDTIYISVLNNNKWRKV